MAMNVLAPRTNPSYSPIMTTDSNDSSVNTSSDTTVTNTRSGLRRSSTLKAYLANKNKLKERQAINIIVDPTVLKQQHDSSSSENELSPQRSAGPMSLLSPGARSMMSPMSGRRIDTELDTLDQEKKAIEDQLSIITQQLSSFSAPTSPTLIMNVPAFTPSSSKEDLTEKRTKLCQELDVLMKKRRELLECWTRDYKTLKQSGSLAKRQEDQFWR
ncbi:hypothetical protein BGZ58_000312 [Dissophora ornata]|nr:hypothetical protein BGZ58_000312 [Dissophora ornata]